MSGLRLSVLWHCQQGETLFGSVLLNYQSSTSIASLVWLGESCLNTFEILSRQQTRQEEDVSR